MIGRAEWDARVGACAYQGHTGVTNSAVCTPLEISTGCSLSLSTPPPSNLAYSPTVAPA
jgi:hypothetical protein